MAFNWDGYFTIAKKLKNSTDNAKISNDVEALQRTAVSRAYYSMYHLAVDYAKTHFGYRPVKNGQNNFHTEIRSEFKNQLANPDYQEVGKILFQLYKARVACDYESEGLGNIKSLLGSTIIQSDKIKSILKT